VLIGAVRVFHAASLVNDEFGANPGPPIPTEGFVQHAGTRTLLSNALSAE
jgi:hypothetical protein